MREVRLDDRVRLVDRGDVVSELLRRPGPTDDLFDVLAAACGSMTPRGRIAMLGFAAGGVIAPLRGMGLATPIVAVDVSSDGRALFRRVSRSWAGAVCHVTADALAWLERAAGDIAIVLDDLSVPAAGGHVKPGFSYDALPRAVRRRLGPDSVLVSNVLPPVDRSWSAALRSIAAPFRAAAVITGSDWENRVVVAADHLPAVPRLARTIRDHLGAIGSNQRERIRVRAGD